MVALGGLAASAARLDASAPPVPDPGVDYYDKLGVTKIINAAGTYTILTASIMPPSVQAAVVVAAKHPVRLLELQKKAGEYLARRLQCEAALVTDGAASALTLGTAACVTRATSDNQPAVLHIPTDMTGLKNEVIIQKAHRYEYDHALRNCGIKFVEVTTLDDYQKAFTGKTVLCHYLNKAVDRGRIGREDWIRVAHQHNVPCFNDAAADTPPISRLWDYTKMGFDLVTFSGGKGMRGPQNSGLLLGRKELIEAAMANNNPFSNTVGRGMKVAKEQIVGMVAAIDWFLSQTDEGMEKEFQRRVNLIAQELHGIPTVKCTTFVPPVANHAPHLLVTYDQNRVKISPLQVAEELRQGNPSIELNFGTGSSKPDDGWPPTLVNTVVVAVWMLQPGEDRIVGQCLRQVLMKAV
ncbi:MAG: aminotransferase class V-fold PLP-dependent enzyme [Terriglobia bacterium]